MDPNIESFFKDVAKAAKKHGIIQFRAKNVEIYSRCFGKNGDMDSLSRRGFGKICCGDTIPEGTMIYTGGDNEEMQFEVDGCTETVL